MSETKKYYWLKLKRDFFKRHDIEIIEGMPNGEKYVLFYMKLLVESIDHEGNLRFNDTIPYNENMLATITRTNIDIVRTAVKLFTELKMIDIMDDGTMYMNQIEKMIGDETVWAQKKRLFREKEDNVLKLSSDCPQIVPALSDKSIELDIRDKSLEKDIRSKPSKHKHGEYKNVLLTEYEMEKLQAEWGDKELSRMLAIFDEGIETKGYKYKNHYLAIKKWKANEKDNAKPIYRKGSFADTVEGIGNLDESAFQGIPF